MKAAAECAADCVVTLGGGSVMDSGKIIAAGAKTPEINPAHTAVHFPFSFSIFVFHSPCESSSAPSAFFLIRREADFSLCPSGYFNSLFFPLLIAFAQRLC